MAFRFVAGISAFVGLGLASGSARAQSGPDGVYGRLRGDTVLSAELSGGLQLAESRAQGLVGGAVRARYLDMVGGVLGYQYGFGPSRNDAGIVAVDLRPLPFARIFQDMERGPQWTDLVLDSIGIELGAAWVRPGRAFGEGGGVGFVLGGGIEAPLVWSRGNGLMLRLGVRWIRTGPWDSQGVGPTASETDSVNFTLGLVGRAMTRLGLVGQP